MEERAWGYELQLDLIECNPDTIRDGEAIARYARRICTEIGMTPYGDPEVIRFGKDPKVSGYSLNQFIEESNITAHFIEAVNGACINIFSCLPFNAETAAVFTAGFFGGTIRDRCFRTRLVL